MSSTKTLPLATALALLFTAGFTGGSCGGEDDTVVLPPPPAPVCADHDEVACLADARCQPVYSPTCACAGDAGLRAPCGPEGCGDPLPPPPPEPCDCPPSAFEGCTEAQVDPCAGLGEEACLSNLSCHAVYAEARCQERGDAAAPCAPDDPSCGGAQRPAPPPCGGPAPFAYCSSEPPISCSTVMCALYCEFGFQVGPDGCAVCACNPPPTCGPVCEIACEYGLQRGPDGCEICACNPPPNPCAGLDETQCLYDHDLCEPRYATAVCDPACDEHGCTPCEPPPPAYLGCFPSTQGECASDADCPNGYCESYASCTAVGCPEPAPSQCVFPTCDDGSQLSCRRAIPQCAPGETVAIREGCYACVDARTCGDVPGPTCEEGPIACDALPPECPAGTVVGSENGCYVCREPTTCQAVRCTDDEPLSCRSLPPQCPADLALALIDGCWACVRPDACQ